MPRREEGQTVKISPLSISPTEVVFGDDTLELALAFWKNHGWEQPVDGDRIARWKQHSI